MKIDAKKLINESVNAVIGSDEALTEATAFGDILEKAGKLKDTIMSKLGKSGTAVGKSKDVDIGYQPSPYTSDEEVYQPGPYTYEDVMKKGTKLDYADLGKKGAILASAIAAGLGSVALAKKLRAAKKAKARA